MSHTTPRAPEETPAHQPRSRAAQLPSEFGALRRDWLTSRGLDVERLPPVELRDAVRQFYAENRTLLLEFVESAQGASASTLAAHARTQLGAKRIAEVRERLGLPKWVALAEAVAFVKTVLDTDDAELRTRYATYCAAGLALDDLRRTLAYEYDVKPVRIDTDIYHQTAERSRSIVECVSNAVDALNETGVTIGRFGVGFYQILSHLAHPDDRVIVTTRTGSAAGTVISFRVRAGQVQVQLTAAPPETPPGTTVELQARGFPAEEAAALVRKHFAFNTVARVVVDGELANNLTPFGVDQGADPEVQVAVTDGGFVVRDSGRGMAPQVILEKLLVPKQSDKATPHELAQRLGVSVSHLVEYHPDGAPAVGGRVVLNVGGVVIEEVPLAGMNTVKALVIDLPSFTLLGEERGEVAVDDVTIRAIQQLIDRIVPTGDIPTINALAQVAETLRRRSRRHERAFDLVAHLRRAAAALPDDRAYLPNALGFERLDIPNAVLIDPLVRQTDWRRIAELQLMATEGEGFPVFTAPMRHVPGEPLIRWRNRIVLDAAVAARCSEDPTVLNLLLRAYGEGHGVKMKSLLPAEGDAAGAHSTVREQREAAPAASIEEYLEREWAVCGFPNAATARTWAERFTPQQRERATLLLRHVLNVLPPELVSPYVDRLLFKELGEKNEDFRTVVSEAPLTAEVLANLASLAADPALPQALLDHGVQLRQRGEPLLEAFGETDTKYWEYKFHRAGEDAVGRWYRVTFWDRGNLVHEDGTVLPYPCDWLGGTTRNEIVVWRGDGRVALFNRSTRTFRDRTLPEAIDGQRLRYFEEVPFGDRRLITASVSDHSNRGPDYGTDRVLFDAETLEPFNPAPELGTPLRYHGPFKDYPDVIPHLLYEVRVRDAKELQYVYVLPDGRRVDATAEGHAQQLGYPSREPRSDVFRAEAAGGVVRVYAGDALACDIDKGAEAREWVKRDWHNRGLEHWALSEVERTFLHEGNEELCLVAYERKTSRTLHLTIDTSGNRYHDDKWNQGVRKQVVERFTGLYDAAGVCRFELGPTELVATQYAAPDGGLRFLVLRYDALPAGQAQDRKRDWSLVREYYAIDSHGQRVPREELRDAPRVGFHWNENEATLDNLEGSHYDAAGQTTSLVEGARWRLAFRAVDFTSSKHRTEKAHAMQLVDRETGTALLPQRFRAVAWNATTQRYECTVLDHEEEGGELRTRILYVDDDGHVLEERLTGPRRPDPVREKSHGARRDPVSLLTPTQALSGEQARSASDALAGGVVEDPVVLQRFVTRIFRYAHLSAAAFAEACPVLLYVEHLEPRILREDVLQELSVRLAAYDDETRVWFYRFLMRLVPPGLADAPPSAFIEKFLRVFHDKLAEEPEAEKRAVYESFCEVRDYDEAFLVNGWNVVRHRTPVPSARIPERIRPLVDYLRCDEAEAFAATPPPLEFRDGVALTLAELIQAKRLHETALQRFAGSPAELRALVTRATAGRSQEHIRREIIHPIAYQGVNNPYLFLRELVQNAHDAVATRGGTGARNVSIDLFSRTPGEMTARIEDHVGMSLQEVLNAFLIPGETTKLGDSRNIGAFGQGLFTLFRGAREVTLRTGCGDGRVTKLGIHPVEREGTIVDLGLTLEQEDGDLRGTIIERTVSTNAPTVEAAYVKNAACTFVSLVDAATVEIRLNDAPINTVQRELAAVDVPGVGTMQIYDAPNNVVTQRGLFLKKIDSDYTTQLTDVERLLTARGYVLRIPDSVSLTRSRNDVARKQAVLPALQEYLPLLKLRAYLELFRQDIVNGHIIQLEHLPYDYFHASYPTSGPIFRDAQRMRRGEPVIDEGRYLERGSLIQLLVLLPVAELDGAAWSLAELKEASHANRRPLTTLEAYDQLPRIIRDLLLEGKRKREEMHSAMQEARERDEIVWDFTWDELADQPASAQQQVAEQRAAYEHFVGACERLNATICAQLGRVPAPDTTLYRAPESKAHASQGSLFGRQLLGWNLSYWRGWRLRPFDQLETTHRELREFLETWSHEMGHILEEQGDFTHNPHLSLRQAEVLAHLLASDAFDAVRRPTTFAPSTATPADRATSTPPKPRRRRRRGDDDPPAELRRAA